LIVGERIDAFVFILLKAIMQRLTFAFYLFFFFSQDLDGTRIKVSVNM
jgi:hypothetical protein